MVELELKTGQEVVFVGWKTPHCPPETIHTRQEVRIQLLENIHQVKHRIKTICSASSPLDSMLQNVSRKIETGERESTWRDLDVYESTRMNVVDR
jgi:hypothetical protein